MDQHDPAAHDPAQKDPAKARFLTIQAVRLSGVALAVLGALVLALILPLPEVAGYVLLALGALDVFVLPLVLARRWKSGE